MATKQPTGTDNHPSRVDMYRASAEHMMRVLNLLMAEVEQALEDPHPRADWATINSMAKLDDDLSNLAARSFFGGKDEAQQRANLEQALREIAGEQPDQPTYTDCRNCGTADHNGYACPCACH